MSPCDDRLPQPSQLFRISKKMWSHRLQQPPCLITALVPWCDWSSTVTLMKGRSHQPSTGRRSVQKDGSRNWRERATEEPFMIAVCNAYIMNMIRLCQQQIAVCFSGCISIVKIVVHVAVGPCNVVISTHLTLRSYSKTSCWSVLGQTYYWQINGCLTVAALFSLDLRFRF